MKTKNNIIFVLLASTVLACGGGESKTEEKKEEKEEVKDLVVTITNPVIQDFVHKIEVQSNIETDMNAMVVSESQGVIRKILVSEGQTVKKGQTMAIIDSEILQDNILEVKKSLELADFVYQKQKTLREKGIGSELEFETSKNQKEGLERKLKTMYSQAGKTRITAPIGGVIDEIFLNLGEMASQQGPFARIVDAKNVKAIAEISAQHLANIKKGTTVELVIPSFNDTTLFGEITNIGNYINPTNRTLKVQTEIKNNTFLIPNMIAIMKIIDFQKAQALTLERRVINQDRQNNYFIYILLESAPEGESNVEKVPIEILSTYKEISAIKVLSDIEINENTKVVDKGAKGITEKDRVVIKSK